MSREQSLPNIEIFLPSNGFRLPRPFMKLALSLRLGM